MQLKKITLDNFRPFKGHHEMIFSTSEDKNVTLVLAENGAGKTTLAQAFQWVLYGKTDGFINKSLLNTLVEKDMIANDMQTVSVSLEIEHNDIDYTITRSQVYKKDSLGNMKAESPKFSVSEKDSYGQTKYHEYAESTSIINSILPEDLSKYFFFDGERINDMSKQVLSGSKAIDFKEAVQNILGLDALSQALDHLNPSLSASVIGRYNSQIDDNGSQEAKELRRRFYNNNEKIEKNKVRIAELEDQIEFYKRSIDECKEKLINFKDIEEQQQRLNVLENDLSHLKDMKQKNISNFTFAFSSVTYKFLSKKMIKEAVEDLSSSGDLDNGIPDIRKSTIDFLRKRGTCICGADLSDNNSDAVKHLEELLKFIPPQSLGTQINFFKQAAKNSLRSSENFFENMKDNISTIRSIDNQVDEKEHTIAEYNTNILKNKNVEIVDIKNNQTEYEKALRLSENELIELKSDISLREKDNSKINSDLTKLELQEKKNDSFEIQRKYAKAAYEMIKDSYEYRENEVRNKLEQEINTLFESIYDGGVTISIDNNYRIKTYVDELENETSSIDSNTAKSYSVIFAFIVGVIKMAREKAAKKDSIDAPTNGEYPLVMDAPLSSFDQKRIKNICDVIPGIARQVIIFIKDKPDGEIAQKYLNDKVGIEYNLSLRTPEVPLDSVISRGGDK